MELLQGPDSYNLENYRPVRPALPTPEMIKTTVPPIEYRETPPVSQKRYAALYSNKHEKMLLRAEHIETMENIRNWFNKNRTHQGQTALTVSDIVNACLDFVFEHPIPFHRLNCATETHDFISRHIVQTTVSRWKQFHELF